MMSAKILAIGAHPDDIELGCGGTVAKHIDIGDEVHCLILTKGRSGAGMSVDRVKETYDALKLLGVSDSNIDVHDFPDREMFKKLISVIEVIEHVVEKLSPDRVYTQYMDDRHQDHRTVFEASEVACRTVPQVLCYETPSSWTSFDPKIFVDISLYSGRKKDALNCHKSQLGRNYMKQEALDTSATFRARQAGLDGSMCEGFLVHRLIMEK